MAHQRTEFFRAVFNGDTEVVKECSKLVNAKDPRFGFTAAHVACARNHAAVLELLHQLGALVNEPTVADVPDGLLFFVWRGPAGSTPLSVAVQKGSVDCVRLLLSWNVDPTHVDTKGRALLHYAEQNPEIHSLLQGTELKQKATKERDMTVKLELLRVIAGQMNCLMEQLEKVRDETKSAGAASTGGTTDTPNTSRRLGSFGSFFMKEYVELKAVRNQLLAEIMSPLD